MSGYITLGDNSDNVSFKTSTVGVTVAANGGDDTVIGSNFNDRINGGSGFDLINAGAGNDFIDGGDGSDRMAGGSGNDTFLFKKGEISNGADGLLDTIIDFQGAGGFNPVQDFIRFTGFGAGTTFTFVRDSAAHLNGAIFAVFDPTDGYTAEILIQFADDGYTADRELIGPANGGFVSGADFGFL